MCFVAWFDEVPRDLINTFRGGGISIYDDEEVFYDRSFFRYEADNDTRPIPWLDSKLEAVVYRRPHPMFVELKRKRDLLFDQYVPAQLRTVGSSPQSAFADVLRDLVKRCKATMPDDVHTAIETEIQELELVVNQ